MADGSLKLDVTLNDAMLRRALANIERKGLNLRINGGGVGGGGNNGLGSITRDANQFTKALDASTGRVLAFGAAASAITLVSQGLSNLVKSTIEVEKSLTDINVILGLSSKGLNDFSKKLFDTAKNTGQSFQVTADAAIELSRQGLGTTKTLKTLNDALILTRLTGLDSADSVKSLTATINSFNREVLNSTEIVNKFAAVDAKFAVSAADLAEGISRVGSSAQDAGLDIDQLIALITTAQQTTARGGAVIGNAFKSIFARISRSDVQDTLNEFGVATRKTDGSFRDSIDILQDLANTYDSANDSTKAFLAESVGGVYQLNILKATLGDLRRQYSTYTDALNTSQGATNEAAIRNAQLNKTLSASANEALQNLTQFSASVGKLSVEPALRKILGAVNNVLGDSGGQDAGETFGEKIGTGLLTGLGNFLSGPGLVGIGAILLKLTQKVGVYTLEALKQVSLIGDTNQKRLNTEASLTTLLNSQPALYNAILSRAISVQQVEKETLAILNARLLVEEKIASVARAITPRVTASGFNFTDSGGVTKTKRGRAAGYLPAASEQEMIRSGAYGTPRTSIVQKGVVRGLGTVDYNTSEKIVKNFPYNGKDSIIPKDPTRAAETFKRFGYAGGMIPNFAAFKNLDVYHGSPSAIQGKISPQSNRRGGFSLGKAFYVSPNKNEASAYAANGANGNVSLLKLNDANAFDADKKYKFNELRDILNKKGKGLVDHWDNKGHFQNGIGGYQFLQELAFGKDAKRLGIKNPLDVGIKSAFRKYSDDPDKGIVEFAVYSPKDALRYKHDPASYASGYVPNFARDLLYGGTNIQEYGKTYKKIANLFGFDVLDHKKVRDSARYKADPYDDIYNDEKFEKATKGRRVINTTSDFYNNPYFGNVSSARPIDIDKYQETQIAKGLQPTVRGDDILKKHGFDPNDTINYRRNLNSAALLEFPQGYIGKTISGEKDYGSKGIFHNGNILNENHFVDKPKNVLIQKLFDGYNKKTLRQEYRADFFKTPFGAIPLSLPYYKTGRTRADHANSSRIVQLGNARSKRGKNNLNPENLFNAARALYRGYKTASSLPAQFNGGIVSPDVNPYTTFEINGKGKDGGGLYNIVGNLTGAIAIRAASNSRIRKATRAGVKIDKLSDINQRSQKLAVLERSLSVFSQYDAFAANKVRENLVKKQILPFQTEDFEHTNYKDSLKPYNALRGQNIQKSKDTKAIIDRFTSRGNSLLTIPNETAQKKYFSSFLKDLNKIKLTNEDAYYKTASNLSRLGFQISGKKTGAYTPAKFKALGYAAGYIPAVGQAIAREKAAGIPSSKIRIGHDSRVGVGVYNTIDEPHGLSQGVSRAISEGKNPKTYGTIPNFASAGAGLSADERKLLAQKLRDQRELAKIEKLRVDAATKAEAKAAQRRAVFDKHQGKLFAASFGLPIIAGGLAAAAGGENTNAGRGIQGTGNAAGYAITGALLGGVPGAVAGGVVGGLVEGNNIYNKYNSKLPELEKATDKLRDRLNEMTDAGGNYLQALDKLNDLYGTNAPQFKIDKAQKELTESLVGVDKSFRDQLISANSLADAQEIYAEALKKESDKLNTSQVITNFLGELQNKERNPLEEFGANIVPAILSPFNKIFDGKDFSESAGDVYNKQNVFDGPNGKDYADLVAKNLLTKDPNFDKVKTGEITPDEVFKQFQGKTTEEKKTNLNNFIEQKAGGDKNAVKVDNNILGLYDAIKRILYDAPKAKAAALEIDEKRKKIFESQKAIEREYVYSLEKLVVSTDRLTSEMGRNFKGSQLLYNAFKDFNVPVLPIGERKQQRNEATFAQSSAIEDLNFQQGKLELELANAKKINNSFGGNSTETRNKQRDAQQAVDIFKTLTRPNAEGKIKEEFSFRNREIDTRASFDQIFKTKEQLISQSNQTFAGIAKSLRDNLLSINLNKFIAKTGYEPNKFETNQIKYGNPFISQQDAAKKEAEEQLSILTFERDVLTFEFDNAKLQRKLLEAQLNGTLNADGTLNQRSSEGEKIAKAFREKFQPAIDIEQDEMTQNIGSLPTQDGEAAPIIYDTNGEPSSYSASATDNTQDKQAQVRQRVQDQLLAKESRKRAFDVAFAANGGIKSVIDSVKTPADGIKIPQLNQSFAGRKISDYTTELGQLLEERVGALDQVNNIKSKRASSNNPDAIAEFDNQIKDLQDNLDRSNGVFDSLSKSYDESYQGALKNIEANKELYQTYNNLATQITAGDADKALKKAVVSGASPDTVRGLLDTSASADFENNNYGSSFQKALQAKILYTWEDGLQSVQDITTNFIGNFEEGMTDALIEIINGTNSAGDAAKNFALVLAKSVQHEATQSLVKSAVGGLGSLIPSLTPSGYSTGGSVIGGSGVKDDVPAMLNGGEYVVRKSSVNKYGTGFLDSLNNGSIKMASGGYVQGFDYNAMLENARNNSTDFNDIRGRGLSDYALTQGEYGSRVLDQIETNLETRAEFDKDLADFKAKYSTSSLAMSIGSVLASIGLSSAGTAFGGGGAKSGERFEGGTRVRNAIPIGRASGGSIHGTDNVSAMLMGGEYVLSRPAVSRIGVGNLDRLNRGTVEPLKFAAGGFVGNSSSPASTGGAVNNQNTVGINININNGKAEVQAASGNGDNVSTDNKQQAETSKLLAREMESIVQGYLEKQSRPGGYLTRIRGGK